MEPLDSDPVPPRDVALWLLPLPPFRAPWWTQTKGPVSDRISDQTVPDEELRSPATSTSEEVVGDSLAVPGPPAGFVVKHERQQVLMGVLGRPQMDSKGLGVFSRRIWANAAWRCCGSTLGLLHPADRLLEPGPCQQDEGLSQCGHCVSVSDSGIICIPAASLGTRSPGSCLLAGGLVPDGSCLCSSPLSAAPPQLHTVSLSFDGWRTTF